MDTIIRRSKRKEAEQAVKDLLARGFEIVQDITYVRGFTYAKGTFDYRKSRNGSSSINDVGCFMAKMRKDD
jgi:hypothetical protein